MMTESLTLTEFLENTGATLSFFDVGRRVSAISRDDFLAFEKTEQSYPYPLQKKAWLAVLQQRPTTLTEPVIWFIQFDLDEQGKLVQATRDYFLHRFVELAAEAADGKTSDLGAALEDNPYVFKPRDDKLANLNAQLGLHLNREPSQYFEHAKAYFSGAVGWDQWAFVGYQGIADLAARIGDNEIADLMTQAIPHLPNEPLVALCQCLENQSLPDELANSLSAKLNSEIADAAVLAALVRGLSQAPERYRNSAIQKALSTKFATDPEVLAAIGGRAWEAMQNPEVALSYLETLADKKVDQAIFNHCISDLLRISTLQQPLLAVMRDPKRSDQLAQAFQAMLS
jgi:hypothetical protein